MAVRLLGTINLRAVCPSWKKWGSVMYRSNCEKLYPKTTRLLENYCKCQVHVLSRNFLTDNFLGNNSGLIVDNGGVNLYLKYLMTCFHDYSGLSWWSIIVLSGASLKICTIPLRIYKINQMEKLKKIHEMKETEKTIYKQILQRQKVEYWSPKKAEIEFKLEMRKEKNKLIMEHNCHPGKVFIVNLLEMLLWSYCAVSWKTLPDTEFKDIASTVTLVITMLTEGPFWCSDLTTPDHYYILPAVNFILYLTKTELNFIENKLESKNAARILYKLMYAIMCLFAVFGAVIFTFLPACTSLFGFSTIGTSILIDLMLLSPKIRRRLKLPYKSYTHDDVLMAFKKRITNLVKFNVKEQK